VHNAIPLCWCAAVGLAVLWQTARDHKSTVGKALVVLYALAAVAWMTGRVYLQVTSIRNAPRLHAALVLKEMSRYKPFTVFMFADEAIYSFHSGIPMPPRLAMISLKRLWSGDMTSAKLAEQMSAIKPGLILLRNDTRELPFQDLIDRNYRMTYQDFTYRLFVNKAIVNKPPLGPQSVRE
jgi:hypothetical protein